MLKRYWLEGKLKLLPRYV
jgi:hypothetical protein